MWLSVQSLCSPGEEVSTSEFTWLSDQFTRSFMWRGKPSPSVRWLRRLFARMSASSMGPASEGGVILCLAGSPAKTSPSLEKGRAWTGSDPVSGPSLPGSLAWFDPTTCSLKTSQRSLFGDWSEFSSTLPASGSMRSGAIFLRPTVGPLTGGGVSGFSPGWQTPATDSFRSRGGDRKDEEGLDQQARRWNTPRARDWKGDGKDCLDRDAENWPTPKASDTHSGHESRADDPRRRNLNDKVTS